MNRLNDFNHEKLKEDQKRRELWELTVMLTICGLSLLFLLLWGGNDLMEWINEYGY